MRVLTWSKTITFILNLQNLSCALTMSVEAGVEERGAPHLGGKPFHYGQMSLVAIKRQPRT